MKKSSKILSVFIAVVFIAILCAVFGSSVYASNEEVPKLTITSKNLSYADSIHTAYAVSGEGFDINQTEIKMLFWNEPSADYSFGTEDYISETQGNLTLSGKACKVFFSEGFAAKEMTDYVYFRAYAVIDGKAYYSEVEKFSILEYVYQMREAGTMNENMSSLLTKMLDYGAAAQIVLKYKTDNLANASFVKLTAEGGAFEDGFTYGRFKVGSTVSLTAPEESGKLIFSHWENSLGECVSESAVYSFTVGNAAETYTAIYKKATSKNLEYTLSDDETYYILSGIGTCKDTDIVIPSEYEGKPVREIGSHAFYGCNSLTSVIIPNIVTSIGSRAFYSCFSLTSVSIENSVTSIGEDAFYDCNSLTSVSIGNSVTSIGSRAFSSCDSLTSITVDEDNTTYKSIDGNLYSKDGTNLIQYAIGKTDTSFEVPSTVTSIGNFAFYWCDSLTNIVIPNSVTSIGEYAFRFCVSLTSVDIPNSVTSIGDYAFTYCTRLKSVDIPNSVTSIGSSAFSSCDSLTSITVDEDNTTYKSIDGNLYSKDEKTLIKYAIGKTDTSFEVPSTVTSIGRYAFENCDSLTSVSIGNSVTNIGNYAFWSCDSLTNIVIPNSVTSIGSRAFYGCYSLTSITVDEDNTAYKSIDGNLYTKDGTTLIQYAIGKTDKSFEVPSTVTTIGSDAFALCDSLTSIVIPSSVTIIGSATFSSCTNLTSVYYGGADADAWANISIGSNNSTLTTATIYYYSETQPTEEGNFWHYNGASIEIWEYICQHVNSDADGKCDICGEEIQHEHYDENGDGKCDFCSATIESEEIIRYPWADGEAVELSIMMTHASNATQNPSGCERYLAGETKDEDSVDKLVDKRNEDAEELVNIKPTYKYYPNTSNYDWGQVSAIIFSTIRSGSKNTPDIFVNYTYDLLACSLKGCFENLKNEQIKTNGATTIGNYFEFNKESYDEKTNNLGYMLEYMNSTSLSEDKVYLLASDYFIDIIRSFFVVPVNISLLESVGMDITGDLNGDGSFTIDDFYQEVMDKKWTYNKVAAYSAAVHDETGSVTGDDLGDVLGFAIGRGGVATNGLLYSTDINVINKVWNSEIGDYEYVYPETCESLVDIYDAVNELVNKTGVYAVTTSDPAYQMYGANPWLAVRTRFCNNKILFGDVILLGSLEFLDYQDLLNNGSGFGIAPVPYYREMLATDNYKTAIHNTARPGAITHGTKNFTACTAFLNYLSTHSRDVLYTYYYTNLQYQTVMGDAGTTEMLKYIRLNVRSAFDKTIEDAVGIYGSEFYSKIWSYPMTVNNYQYTEIDDFYSDVISSKKEILDTLYNEYPMLP